MSRAKFSFLSSNNVRIYMDDINDDRTVDVRFCDQGLEFYTIEEMEDYAKEICEEISDAENFDEIISKICIYLDVYRVE